MSLAEPGHVRVRTKIAAAVMAILFVPLTKTSTANTLAVVTSNTNIVEGFLRSYSNAAGDAIAVVVEEGQEIYAIAANTSMAIGDRVMLDSTDPTRLTKLTPKLDGTSTSYRQSVGTVVEVPSAAGGLFLIKFKLETIPV